MTDTATESEVTETETTEAPAKSSNRPSSSAPTTPRLKTRYREEIVPALRSEFEIANIMEVPGLVKVVVNMGVGEAARDSLSLIHI